jgi:hypothetical protein
VAANDREPSISDFRQGDPVRALRAVQQATQTRMCASRGPSARSHRPLVRGARDEQARAGPLISCSALPIRSLAPKLRRIPPRRP